MSLTASKKSTKMSKKYNIRFKTRSQNYRLNKLNNLKINNNKCWRSNKKIIKRVNHKWNKNLIDHA